MKFGRYASSPWEGGVGAECLHRGVWGNEVSPLTTRDFLSGKNDAPRQNVIPK